MRIEHDDRISARRSMNDVNVSLLVGCYCRDSFELQVRVDRQFNSFDSERGSDLEELAQMIRILMLRNLDRWGKNKKKEKENHRPEFSIFAFDSS